MGAAVTHGHLLREGRNVSGYDERHEWDSAVGLLRKMVSQGATNTAEQRRQLWRRLGAAGILGLPVPPEYGGLGCTAAAASIYLECLGYVCPDNGICAMVCASLLSCIIPVWKRGTQFQKKKYLRSLCSGEWVVAHAATEPEAGSDIYSLQTTAMRKGRDYVLNGLKTYSLNAPLADLFVVLARTREDSGVDHLTAFLVERSAPGAKVTRELTKIGLQSAPMGEVCFDDCIVPEENRLGPEGAGAMIFQAAMLWERSLIVAPQVGVMRRSLEASIDYAKKRRQFGSSIGKFQSISNRIAEMKMRLELSRLLLREAARNLDGAGSDPLTSAMAKLFISEAAVANHLDALRIQGGRGFLAESGCGQDLCDCIGLTILSGTSDIQRQIIARCVGL